MLDIELAAKDYGTDMYRSVMSERCEEE